MSELFEQLGVDWKLLAAQSANFLIVLVILRLTVYKPLLDLLEKRRFKIEEGIKNSELAKTKLEESEKIKAIKIAEADKESLKIIDDTKIIAKDLEEKMLDSAKKKGEEIILAAKERGEEEISIEKDKLYGEALNFIKAAVQKTTEISPDSIDEKMINQVILSLKKYKS